MTRKPITPSAIALFVTVAFVTPSVVLGVDPARRSISSPSINAADPLLTVVEYDRDRVKHRGLIEPNSAVSKRLQSLINATGWKPGLGTESPSLHFRPESAPDFTINISPSQAVVTYTTLGIRRHKVRDITSDEFRTLLEEVAANVKPVLKAKKLR